MPAKLISRNQAAFIKFELINGDMRQKKIALQRLSKFYRDGYSLTADVRKEFETEICGHVLWKKIDSKVVRWCLNTLAQLGQRESSEEYIRAALRKYESSPEIVAAGVAALCKIYSGHVDEIEDSEKIDPKIWTLSALQNTNPKNLNLENFRINIEKDDVEILKLALITVGLNRDVENLFHPRCHNGDIIKALGCHDDSIIQQYSVWAVLENKKLSIDDLGLELSISEIEKLPVNVQSKIFELVAEKDTNTYRKHSLIADGAYLNSDEARFGLAKGLTTNYYEGLPEITLSWFDNESHNPVRENLAEHFSAWADTDPLYEEKAISIFHADATLRHRLFLGATRKPFYVKLQLEADSGGSDDMFSGQRDEFIDLLSKGKMLTGGADVEEVKVLMFFAAPKDQKAIKIKEEYDQLQQKLNSVKIPTRKVTLDLKMNAKVDGIQDAILNESPEIIHFSGHSDSDFLCFENEIGGSAMVPGEAIASTIELHKESIKCVLLNSCFSDAICKKIGSYVECLIGCDESINDAAAIAFARGFYRAIGQGKSYKFAFESGINEVSLENKSKEAKKYTFHSN